MKKTTAAVLVSASLMCPGIASAQTTTAALPRWTFAAEMIFPADRSLHRPEDGVVLPDGRLVVADQGSGLRLIHADGSGRPLGRFAEAGYRHSPPEIVSTINGVTLEPSGSHILGADVFRGGIYSVNVATEAVELVHQHPFRPQTCRARGREWERLRAARASQRPARPPCW